jgi:hypothetical protein
MPSAAPAHSWKALDCSFVSNGWPSSFKEDCLSIYQGSCHTTPVSTPNHLALSNRCKNLVKRYFFVDLYPDPEY